MEKKILEYYYPDGKTLHELFMRGVRISGDKPCCGWRLGPALSETWVTYNEVFKRSKWVGSGLIALGAKPDPSQFIGILAGNRIESVLIEQACNCYSMVTVSIPNSSVEGFENIIQFCKLKIIVIDTISAARKILVNVINSSCFLKVIVIMEKLNDEIIRLGNIYDIKTVEFFSLEMTGKMYCQNLVPPKPDDLHTIAFTSGTTGEPKGAMIKHKNIVASVSGIYAYQEVDSEICFDEKQLYLSYFPSFNIIEIMGKSLVFGVGGKVAFYSGDRTKILDDAKQLKPTFFPLPPQLISRVFDLVKSKAEKSPFKSCLFKAAMKTKLKLLKRGIITKQTVWDYVVFKKVQNLFGGRVVMTFTGGAPVTMDSLNFLKCALGIKAHFVYGLTEASGIVSIAHSLDFCPGSVGPPLPCCFVKLTDAPEQNYFVENGFGEICIKGQNVFSGYYQNESLTSKVFDDDGWYRTGDIGTWLDNGSLKIIDRKKSIFLLSTGERIIPHRIESVFVQIPIIQQIFVYGDNSHNFIAAIIVSTLDVLKAWGKNKEFSKNFVNIDNSSIQQNYFLDEMKKQATINNFKPHEIPKKIFISEKEFSFENDLLTSSGKPKRDNIYIKFKNEIDSMFL